MSRIVVLGRRTVLWVGLGLAAIGTACATTSNKKKVVEPDEIRGLVLDPEGKPVAFAKVSVLPQAQGETADHGKSTPPPVDVPPGVRGLAVTTEGGRFSIDHVSDDSGTSLGLPAGWYYEVTVYKPGFHPWKDSVLFQMGALQVDVTLYPDSISLEDIGNVVDTSAGETNTGTGVLRQGQ